MGHLERPLDRGARPTSRWPPGRTRWSSGLAPCRRGPRHCFSHTAICCACLLPGGWANPPASGRFFMLGTATLSVLGWERGGAAVEHWNVPPGHAPGPAPGPGSLPAPSSGEHRRPRARPGPTRMAETRLAQPRVARCAAASPGWGSPPAPVPPPSPPPGPPPPAPPGNEEIGIGPNTRCYEHPDRLAGSICRSCNKPICADCMVQAPVGWHCRQCARKNAKKSPVIRYRPGTGTLPTLSQVPVTMGFIAVCVVVYIVSSATPTWSTTLGANWRERVLPGPVVPAFHLDLFPLFFFHILA